MYTHICSYVAVETVNNEVYVCTRRAALNMAYQEMLKSGKSVEPIAELPGVDLMGAQLKGTVKPFWCCASGKMFNFIMENMSANR